MLAPVDMYFCKGSNRVPNCIVLISNIIKDQNVEFLFKWPSLCLVPINSFLKNENNEEIFVYFLRGVYPPRARKEDI